MRALYLKSQSNRKRLGGLRFCDHQRLLGKHVEQIFAMIHLATEKICKANGIKLTSTCHSPRVRLVLDNCFGFGFGCRCHIQAHPNWDLVCESAHGCAAISVAHAMSGALQRTDPRCTVRTISPADAEALRQLNELLKVPEPAAKAKAP